MKKETLTSQRLGYIQPVTTHVGVRHDQCMLAGSKQETPADDKMKSGIEQQAGGQTFTPDWDTEPIS
ncbi:MAG: hypothetical protein HUK00_02950 [Bacteroidaceae bacterium]|nr:hypothetical protein [Bacteroidaceae bacterium]